MQRVLVVDDDEDIRDIIAFRLRKQSYEVSSVGDPRAALELAPTMTFDAAILDWSMPWMDGGELCARLRELPGLREVPILVVTAHADEATRERAFAAGATRFITKPLSLKELVDVLAELLAPEPSSQS